MSPIINCRLCGNETSNLEGYCSSCIKNMAQTVDENNKEKKQCTFCGEKIALEAKKCPLCLEFLDGSSNIDVRVAVGVISVVITGFGVFLPFINIPVIGSVNLFRNGEGDGVIILFLSLLCLFGFVSKKFLLCVLASIANGVILYWCVNNVLDKLNELSQRANQDLEGNLFKGLSNVFSNAVQIEVGAYVIAIGVSGALVAAFWANQRELEIQKESTALQESGHIE
jgi:hypothetical protein